MFDSVPMAPPDAILGLTEAYKADPNPKKINLGVGVFQDESGRTPVLQSVKEAERRLIEEESSKSYMPIDGSPAYAGAVQRMLFGVDSAVVAERRAATSDTPGGTGALRVAGDYLHANHPGAALWLSDPTWANHRGVFTAAGLTIKTYPYLDAGANALNFDAMLAALREVPAGDVVLLHGCCHNPTGVDPSTGQWEQVAALLARRGVLPLVDFAYQGFSVGIEEDAAGLRAVAAVCPELLICSSFSKNFGLYRERVGALTVVGSTADATAAVQSQVKTVIRRNYSNPPAHGAAVVATILEDPALTARWRDELAAMRDRINGMRRAFRQWFDDRGVRLNPRGNAFITDQKGMFTMSGLTKDHVARLRDEFSIYIVGSGRINVAGITPGNLDYLCESIAAVI